MFRFIKKLTNTKLALKNWNRDVYGPLHSQLEICKQELAETQNAVLLHPRDMGVRDQEKEARTKYSSVLAQEEKFARQKSCQLWLEASDSNTKFFYYSIKSRSARNTICRLWNPDDSYCSDPEEIKERIVHFYQDLLNRNSFSDTPLPQPVGTVSDEENIALFSPVSEVEIHNAVSHMKALSSPGPDGFPAKFYQHFWTLIKEDLTLAVNFFFLKGKLLRQVSHSFIALIPKTTNDDSLDSYRPISLCNSFYKIITKIMALRLQPLLPKLVSKHQSAFIKGRSIQHNILLAHELIKYHNQGKVRACIKVDLKKAFDSVNWSFFGKILRRCGFNDRWTTMCMECVSFAKYSILINGAPMGFFASSCGIHQGDPLSSLLFTLVMDSFSSLLNQSVKEGKVGSFIKGDLNVSHLCFADDLLVFSDCKQSSAVALTDLFSSFGAASRLYLNTSKSQTFTSCNSLSQTFCTTLGISLFSLPVRYLGIPLLNCTLKYAHCLSLVDKIRKRILSWAGHSLSLADRIELIKSVLSSLQTFWSSSFILPRRIQKDIELTLRTFLWQGHSTVRRIHHIAWSTICSPLSEGGFGIKSIREWNKGAVGIRFWELACKKESLWTDSVQKRYIRNHSIWSAHPPYGCTSSWSSILKARTWNSPRVKYVIF
ncbi:hypothetical protein QJS10_CPB18g00601 [Acorus calamus]|uniref:Reverse transcriptase domain-containing protein n=1 Tax=Acorus calamus TaxID=4465 RepID=A0AAV9CPC0_ACOCL|nr:hypothetical protein QJS10_CPB18g00601 [Acorus calamus]